MNGMIVLVETLSDRRFLGVSTDERNAAHRALEESRQATGLCQLVLESFTQLALASPLNSEQDQDVGK